MSRIAFLLASLVSLGGSMACSSSSSNDKAPRPAAAEKPSEPAPPPPRFTCALEVIPSGGGAVATVSGAGDTRVDACAAAYAKASEGSDSFMRVRSVNRVPVEHLRQILAGSKPPPDGPGGKTFECQVDAREVGEPIEVSATSTVSPEDAEDAAMKMVCEQLEGHCDDGEFEVVRSTVESKTVRDVLDVKSTVVARRVFEPRSETAQSNQSWAEACRIAHRRTCGENCDSVRIERIDGISYRALAPVPKGLAGQ